MSCSNLSLREASVSDARVLAIIEVEASREAYRGVIAQAELDALDVDELAARWRRNIQAPKSGIRIMVCSRDGQVVARCSHGPRRDGELAGLEGEIHGLYAHPNAWGIGAGSLLLSDALHHLDQRFEATVVWALSQSPRAHACYARAGFTIAADGIEHRQHPEAPLCLMRRQRRPVG